MFVFLVHGRADADREGPLSAWSREAAALGLHATATLSAPGALAMGFATGHRPPATAARGGIGEDGCLRLFDGRLSYREDLRARLAAAADSDDLALWTAADRRWHAEAPGHLDGDYAALRWDPAATLLRVCTDHASGLRCYYARTGDGGLCVATHLPLLLATPGVDRRLDGLALGIVPLGLIVPGDTPFRAVERLPGGSLLTFVPGGPLRVSRWWQPEAMADDAGGARRPAPELAEELAGLLAAAVDTSLDPAGPAATMLSGGLDSSLVACLAARSLLGRGRELLAFTAVPHPGLDSPPRPGWDASDWPVAARVAERYPNVRHQAVHAGTPCLIDSFHDWHRSGASPARNSANCQWIDKMAAEARAAGAGMLLGGGKGNVTVSLDGGAAALNAHLAAGAWDQVRAAWRRAEASPFRQLARMVKAALLGSRPPSYRALLAWTPVARQAIAAPVLAARRQRLPERPASLHEARVRTVRLGTVLAPDYRARHGVDLRDPTADRRVVEFLLRQPLAATLHDGHGRALARLAGAGVVPEEIRWRTRRGQQSPEQAGYFALHAGRYREAWAIAAGTPLRELFDPGVAGAVLEALIEGRAPARQAPFMHQLLDLGLFLDHAARRWGSTVAFDGERPSRPAGAPND